jgi:hypothetical protein
MRKTGCLILIIILVLFSGWFYWKYYYTFSDGNRTGMLQKFSHRGNALKTYEGELVLSGLVSNNMTTMSTEKFYFSVDRKDLAQKLMGLEGQKVVVHYLEKNGALFWRGDTRYIVDSIRVVGQ